VKQPVRANSRIHHFALVGPGRAGLAVASALLDRGLHAVAVAGRDPNADSTRRGAQQLRAPTVSVTDAGQDADLVVLATPDAAIATVARDLAPSLRPGALVVHLSGAASLHVLDQLASERPDVEIGSLHPLQSLPNGALGRDRLPGSWCAVDGSPRVERLASTLGMRPFRVDERDRVRYHATACVASNHLVALLGQVERLARSAGVPFEAFLPLVRATLDNVEQLGPTDALTGPVARRDLTTVAQHLDALPAEELDAYAVLAREAGRLAGVEPHSLEAILA
jgi:predicted short-subunit dehydrogenase-like oxidoreductase (DUF2520 family)